MGVVTRVYSGLVATQKDRNKKYHPNYNYICNVLCVCV